jgi:hypothetical protein
MDQKNTSFFSCKFFSFFAHQNPGFGTGSGSAFRKNAGSALSITNKIMAPGPSPPTKLVKTSIRPNRLEFGLYGVCSSSLADELEYIYRRNFLEFIKELVTHLAQTN